MDIPLLGNLFKSNSVNDSNSELVIFLTPTIDDTMSIGDAHIDPTLLVKSPLDDQPTP